jgi:AraC-like DNA-binding protein
LDDKIMPATGAHWMVKTVSKLGIPKDKILEGTGLDDKWLQNNEASISSGQYQKIVQNALTESGDQALGLTIGKEPILTEQGFWGYAVMCSPNLREAASVAAQYMKVTGPLVDITRKKENERQIWEILPPFVFKEPKIWIYAVEELLSTLFHAACFLVNTIVGFEKIHLSYPRPVYSRQYYDLFQCPICFDRTIDAVFFSNKYLDLPIEMSHQQMAAVCKRQCEEMAIKLGRKNELIETIRELISSSSFKINRIDEVAGKLNMGTRTLQRRLKGLNTTFQFVLDETRSDFARTFLRHTTLTVDQIAGYIGFSETSNFRHAFKRWTGLTIKEFRENQDDTTG